jgi:quercetin dioxygenase-like cupin family protein
MPNQADFMRASAAPAARATVLLSGTDTEGAFSLVLLRLPPHSEVPPDHSHPAHTEGYFVLSGMLAVTQGGSTITLHQGMAGSTPSGVAHTCWNPAATPLLVLLHYTPGGLPAQALALAAALQPEGYIPALTAYAAEDSAELA